MLCTIVPQQINAEFILARNSPHQNNHSTSLSRVTVLLPSLTDSGVQARCPLLLTTLLLVQDSSTCYVQFCVVLQQKYSIYHHYRILLPRENQTLTLVLGGIRAPRSARGPSDRGEPFGTEASDFATRRYMQRDVEIEVFDVDKSGGFIGALYLNKTENAAITLVKEGLASVHSYSADSLPWAKSLYDSEVCSFFPIRYYIMNSFSLSG